MLNNTVRGMTVKRFIVAIIGICAIATVPSQVGAAGLIGGRPGAPRDNEPRSRSIFIHTIDAGKSARDKVLVSNRSDKKQSVELYAVDAITTNTGAFTCRQKAEKSLDAGTWINLSKSEVTLSPRTTELVDFSIAVPKKTDVGEHNACIVFAAKDDVEKVGGSLTIRTRSAIRVAITIPGELKRGVNIQSFDVKQNNDVQTFTVLMRNTGNVSADTNVDVQMKSLFGKVAYTNHGQYPVLSGNSLEVNYDNKKTPFWGGFYLADATLSYNKDANKWDTKAKNTLQTEKSGTKIIFVIPQLPAIIVYFIVILAVSGVVAYWWFEKRKVQLILDTWQHHKIKKGDTLDSLSTERKANWHLVAKVNKLKAPYTLKVGDSILLPRRPRKSSDTAIQSKSKTIKTNKTTVKSKEP